MTAPRRPAAVHVWAGDLQSQQLAFAHLLDTADRTGAPIDLDRVEVVPVAGRALRLGHALGPEARAAVERATGDAPCLVLLLTEPGAPAPFEGTDRLRYLGTWSGHSVGPGDWA